MNKNKFKAINLLICISFLLPSYNLFAQEKHISLRDYSGPDSLKTGKDTASIKNVTSSYEILYARPGIVIYKDHLATFAEANADNACLPAGQTTNVSRCDTFTIPTTQPLSLFKENSWISYNGDCNPSSTVWTSFLTNHSLGRLMSRPYYVEPGVTYKYCVNVSLPCPIISLCLSPSVSAVPFKIEHFQKKIPTAIALQTLPDISTISNRDYFAICADGTTSSEFKVTTASFTGSLTYDIRIKEDPTGANKEKYGYFSFVGVDANKSIFNYQHPSIPPNNGQFIIYNMEVFNYDNNSVLQTFKLRIYRPPLLMVHGTRDDGNAYNKMFAEFRNNIGLYSVDWMLRADYMQTSKDYFVVNKNVVKNHINKLLGHIIEIKCAVGKVDIIAHSMGGLLSRIYLQSDNYENDINKLITHNTPHSGAQSANRLADPFFGFTTLGKIARFFGDYGGATIDLQVGPVETIDTHINNRYDRNDGGGYLNKNIVPIHTIATTHPYDPLDPFTVDPGFKYQAVVLGLGMPLNSLFRNDLSDLVVPLASQLGGLIGNHTSIIPSPQVHSAAQENDDLIIKVEDLLIADPKGFLFAQDGYHPIDTLQYVRPATTSKAFSLNTPNGTIDIAQPINNKIVNLGTQLNIIVNGTNLTDITVYIKVSESIWKKLTSTGNTLNVNTLISSDYRTGLTYNFCAIGTCTNGELVFNEGTFKVVNCVNSYSPLSGVIEDYYYQAKTNIVSNGTVNFGRNVYMTAGKSIIFNPGFTADKFTQIEAKIEGCEN